jgi:hypothetical protein
MKTTKMVYMKTKTAHLVRYWGDSLVTLCSIDVNLEEWRPPNEVMPDRICKRCQVASGVPGRLVYNYGPMAWKRRRY